MVGRRLEAVPPRAVEDLAVEEVDRRNAAALDGGEHRALHSAIAKAHRQQESVFRDETGRAGGLTFAFVERNPIEIERARDLLEADGLFARNEDYFGHDLEREAPYEAMLQECAEAISPDGAERRDRAVDGELAPAFAAEVGRHFDRPHRFKGANERVVRGLEGLPRAFGELSERETALGRSFVNTRFGHGRTPGHDGADHAVVADDLRDAFLAKSVL